MGTGVYSEGTTITLNTTFKPKMLFIFLPPNLTVSEGSSGSSGFAKGYAPYPVHGDALSSSQYYYSSEILVGIWQESMSKMIISSYAYGVGEFQGIQIAFSTTDSSITWKTEKIDGSTKYGFDNYSSFEYDVSPYFFNAESTIYSYIAFG